LRTIMNAARLRIALISEHASPLAAAGGVDAGGQNIYVDRVARTLAAAGHEVDVLTRRDSRNVPTAVGLCRGARVLHIDAGPPEPVVKEDLMPYMPAFAAAAGTLIKRDAGYDVLHANFFMSGWVALALRRRFGIPLVVTFHALGLVRQRHQGGADHFPAARIDIERQLANDSDAVVATCPQDQHDLETLYGADPARIHIVPCGVDTRAFRHGDKAAARQRLRLPAQDFIVLQLGRMVPRKGIDNVVRAMALLDGQPNARLVVIGGASRTPDEEATPEIARLRQLAAEIGVQERVLFAGRRDQSELRDWYVAADAFVTTPWYEPFGITPLEAMACGTPVIGTAVGGIRTTVVDEVTGFLVPPKDPAALAQRLQRLRDNPALGQAMGRAGVHRVRSHFTWQAVAERLAEVYAGVVDRSAVESELPLALPTASREVRAGMALQ
jgi:D-inositol-3-phosphate glycosyltransferase